jgi:uncharacterized protein (TIGR02391 family)
MARFAFESDGLEESQIKGIPTPDLARVMLKLVARARATSSDLNVADFGITTMDGLRPSIELEVREAWGWLSRELYLVSWGGLHGHCRLTRAGAALASELASSGSAIRARAITADMVPKTLTWAVSSYHAGQYDSAVFEATKAVEIAVRDAAGFAATDIGAPLMRKAFASNSGPLSDTTAVVAEQDAMAHLFAGAIGVYRNSAGHRTVGLSDQQAWDVLMLAAHLLRIVDERRPPP